MDPFFPPSDRLIYTAPAGTKYDPLDLHRKLILHTGGRANDLLAAWSDPDAEEVDRARAEEGLVVATRKTFDLKPFAAGEGALDSEVLATLTDYLEWLSGKGLRGVSSQK